MGSTARRISRESGEAISFSRSKLVLVDEKRKKALGTRIRGVLPREVGRVAPQEITLRAKRLV